VLKVTKQFERWLLDRLQIFTRLSESIKMVQN